MAIQDCEQLVATLASLPNETEWVEFKENNDSHETIAKYVSALANSAIYNGEQHGFLVFGIRNEDHEIVGTNVRLADKKIGNETFIHWLNRHIKPPLNIEHSAADCNGVHVEVLRIDPGYKHTVRFKDNAFIRIDSSLHPIEHHPAREAAIWQAVNRFSYEKSIVSDRIPREMIQVRFYVEELISSLALGRAQGDMTGYLLQEGLVVENMEGGFDITNLLVMVSAKNFKDWPGFERKGIRVVSYKDTTKLDTVYDVWGQRGYFSAFDRALVEIMGLIPHREEMQHGLRKNFSEIPAVAIREVLGNAIIHQDFTDTSRGPLVEVYTDRVKITNPGKPLIEPDRFVDAPSHTRNSAFADIMRRLGVCEERGSGIDRAFAEIEKDGLPPPLIQVTDDSTVVTIFGPRKFADMSKDERIRACYWHACLGVEQNNFMSNASLRKRFKLGDRQYPQVSEVIRDACTQGMVRPLSDEQANRNARYVPYWY